MVPEITWSAEAIDTYNSIIQYLRDEWSEKEINNFAARVAHKLSMLQTHPLIGTIANKKHKIYRTIVHKNVTLYYRYKPTKKEIELVVFWDTRQNPERLKY